MPIPLSNVLADALKAMRETGDSVKLDQGGIPGSSRHFGEPHPDFFELT